MGHSLYLHLQPSLRSFSSASLEMRYRGVAYLLHSPLVCLWRMPCIILSRVVGSLIAQFQLPCMLVYRSLDIPCPTR